MAKNNTPKNEWEQQYEREYRRIIQAANRQKKLGYYIPENILPIKPSKVKNVTPEDVERLIELTPQKIRKSSIYIDTDTGEAFPGLDLVNSHHKPAPSNAKIRESSIPKPKQITPKTQTTKKQNKQKQTKTKKTILNNDEKFEEPVTSIAPKENNLNMQIIEDITKMLNEWQPKFYWNAHTKQRKATYVASILDKWELAIEEEGVYGLAYRLENMAIYWHRLVDRLIHASDSQEEDDANFNEFITFLTGKSLTAEESDKYSQYGSTLLMNIIKW